MGRYREMQAFDAVARAGSLAAAARHLGLSPATIMRRLVSLETRLNTTLLLRGPRGVSLSAAGEHFALSCRQVLEQTAEAERAAAGVHANPEGQLTIAVPLLIEAQVFTPIALAYLDAFPRVSLAIRASEDMPMMLKDGIDVAITVGALPDSSAFAIPLGRVRPMLCASPGYLATWGHPATLDDLKGHRRVAATSPGYDAQWRFAWGHSSRVVKPALALGCTTQRAAIRAATLGVGLVRCLSYEAHEELHDGRLVPVLAACPSVDAPAQLIYRHGRRADARVRSFISFAIPLLRAHPAFAG
jgi:DNA-binding transcriptional LysR family regulator